LGRKKTTEKYKLELEEVNKKNGTNIRLKEGVEYVDAITKIKHICTCGKSWDIKPNHIISGNTKSCGLCYTFSQWCINNNHQDVLNLWDYELNKNVKPIEITYSTNKSYYFRCPRGIHKSEKKKISNFIRGQKGSIKCNVCNSFAQWGIDNIGDDFLEKYWDYEKNTINPWKISKNANKPKIWIFCQEKEYHDSYDINCFSFVNGSRCGYCRGDRIVHPKDSFGQYLINTYGENSLDLYWDYNKNKEDPFLIRTKSQKTIYIYCQEKDYHGSYPTTPYYFTTGCRCSYCASKKIHPLDSIGKILEDNGLLHLWSDKNKKSPYKYASNTPQQKVYWKCPEGKHEDYLRNICESRNVKFRCPNCSNEQKESIMATTLKQVLKYEYPSTEWEFNAGFRTSKNMPSRYDIYVPHLNNLLIECQSEYHDNPEKQKLDKLKKEYAIKSRYNYLAIDKRDYSPLEAIQIFFPEIKEIPDYVDITKDTMRKWDLEEAQELLNEGYTYQEVADIIGTGYSNIQGHVFRGVLKKPEEYKIKRYNKSIKIACLDIKNNKLIKIYNSITEAAIDLGKNTGNICMVLKKLRNKAYGFKWMYYNEYIELNNI